MSVAQGILGLPLLSLLIVQLILANIRMAENEKDNVDNGGVKKRILKCSGCKVNSYSLPAYSYFLHSGFKSDHKS